MSVHYLEIRVAVEQALATADVAPIFTGSDGGYPGCDELLMATEAATIPSCSMLVKVAESGGRSMPCHGSAMSRCESAHCAPRTC